MSTTEYTSGTDSGSKMDVKQEIEDLKKAQEVQAATQAGAQATQAASQAGMAAAVIAGSAGLVVGMFLAFAIASIARAS
jgi:hypothetical protein